MCICLFGLRAMRQPNLVMNSSTVAVSLVAKEDVNAKRLTYIVLHCVVVKDNVKVQQTDVS